MTFYRGDEVVVRGSGGRSVVVSEVWIDKGTEQERPGVRVLAPGATSTRVVEHHKVLHPARSVFRCSACRREQSSPVPVGEMWCSYRHEPTEMRRT